MIQGLTYRTDVLTEEQEQSLLLELDGNGQWVPITDSPNSRRVQHYGFRYDYRTGLATTPTTAIPSEWFELFHCANAQGMNQVIVNEYEPGQGSDLIDGKRVKRDLLHRGTGWRCPRNNEKKPRWSNSAGLFLRR